MRGMVLLDEYIGGNIDEIPETLAEDAQGTHTEIRSSRRKWLFRFWNLNANAQGNEIPWPRIKFRLKPPTDNLDFAAARTSLQDNGFFCEFVSSLRSSNLIKYLHFSWSESGNARSDYLLAGPGTSNPDMRPLSINANVASIISCVEA
jgi:hypothetical protein